MKFTANTIIRSYGGYQTVVTDGKNEFLAVWGWKSEYVDFFTYDRDSGESDFCFTSGRDVSINDELLAIQDFETFSCNEAAKYIEKLAYETEALRKAVENNVEEEFDY